jgi:hypothetical protein
MSVIPIGITRRAISLLYSGNCGDRVMVYHLNAFEHIGRPGGVVADLYKYWRNEGVQLAKQRQRPGRIGSKYGHFG